MYQMQICVPVEKEQKCILMLLLFLQLLLFNIYLNAILGLIIREENVIEKMKGTFKWKFATLQCIQQYTSLVDDELVCGCVIKYHFSTLSIKFHYNARYLITLLQQMHKLMKSFQYLQYTPVHYRNRTPHLGSLWHEANMNYFPSIEKEEEEEGGVGW